MKYIARPKEYKHPGMHSVGHIAGDDLVRGDAMPLPDRLEIVSEARSEHYFLCRYTAAGEFCGDTWHEDLEAAFAQAEYEYGLSASDFLVLHDGAPDRTHGDAA